MNFKQLLRKLMYKFNSKDVTFESGLFAKLDTKLLLDRDACVTICSYDEKREVFTAIIRPVDLKEC